MNEIIPWDQWIELIRPYYYSNKDGKRDPEMHQTKKGNQWYHGMKVHAGVDAGSGYVHTITGTAVNLVKCFRAGRTVEFCKRRIHVIHEFLEKMQIGYF